MRHQILLFSVLVFATESIFAQWECPSQLAAHLNPLGEKNLFWGAELTAGTGAISNNIFGNGMGIIGLDWSTEKSTFYLEGGVKYWNRYDYDRSRNYSNQHLGIRELYYQYKARPGNLTLGIQSARSDDGFLLNERILGTNLRLNHNQWSLNLLGGTVTKDFARNGAFCNVAYLYDIFPLRERTLIGNGFGQTNLAAFSLKYQPGKKSSLPEPNNSNDEFSSAEFQDDLSSSGKSGGSGIKLTSAGMIAYHEFGNWINHKFITCGLFAQTEWGEGWYFKPEILYQAAPENHAFIYSIHLEKMREGEKSRTNFSLRYLGQVNLDPNARVLNSFSNIFAGDIIRLDAIDLPFVHASVKHTLPRKKIHFKTQFTGRVSGKEMFEWDVEAGKKFREKLQINVMGGFVRSYLTDGNTLMGRIELRYYL